MRSIIKELEKCIAEHPEQLLYSFLDVKGDVKESYTYEAFDSRVKNIASFIFNQFEFKVGDRILLAYPPGIEMICAFFACVRLGLIPVPVYPPSANGFESALLKMMFIATDCQASAIFTTRSYQLSAELNMARLGDESNIKKDSIDHLEWISTDDIGNSLDHNYQEGFSAILFLQYTSGSTNDPKGVILTHENILDNCDNVVDHTPIGVSWLPQYHDMGLIGYYLFFALKGGTTYGFSPTDFILRPSLWLETITKYKGTATSAPNFAFDYCLQSGKISEEVLANLDLSSLRFVMNAAEPVKAHVYERFIQRFKEYGLNPQQTFAAYGLAENTLAVTNYGRSFKNFDRHALEQKQAVESFNIDSAAIMSCGQTLGDTKVKIVNCDNEPVEVTDGEVGEVWVTGSSKGQGYWNRPELSKETFNAILPGFDDTWLRTGDLGFIHDGELYICGRSKDMIILRGLNYYPQDIEAIIENDPSVRAGSVAAFASQDDGESSLNVIIGVKNKRTLPDMDSINIKVFNYLGIRINKAVFVIARDVLKTSSGKIRRLENKLWFETNQFEQLGFFELDIEHSIIKNLNKINSNGILDDLFNSYGLIGTETATLGEAGLDSLKLAEFAHDLKQVIIKFKFDDLADEIDIRVIQKIAVSELFNVLLELSTSNRFARYKFKRSFARIHQQYQEVEKELMKRDSKSILQNLEYLIEQDRHSKGQILVTGGTGFLGPFIIKSLLEQQSDEIYVLVRAENETLGYERLKKSFSTINAGPILTNQFENRVHVVCGDLGKYRLGMDDVSWSKMEQNIHTIFHNGALVNYLLDYESMRGANVDGTNEVIRLASSIRLKVLNYISTTFIFGWSTKDILFESDTNSEMELLDFGYSQSKWVSERVVEHAFNKGLPGRVFRPALISPSVQGDGYNFDISIRLLAFMMKYGIGTTAQNQVSFTPADVAANNIVAISFIDESINKTFHVTRDEFSSMQDVTRILSKLAEKEFANYPLKAFVPEVISQCKKDDLLFPLLNFLVRSVDNISSMEFKRYDNRNYVKYRQQSKWGIEDHSLEEVVNGIFEFMIKNNIVTTETLSHGKQ